MSQSDAASEGTAVARVLPSATTIAPVAKTMNTSSENIDIWRDTPLRYLGYANEVGESFRPIFPKYVRPSYIVAFGYVGCDTLNKAIQSYQENKPTNVVVRNTCDALLWQVLASVLIPGKIVHLITHSADSLSKTNVVERCCPQNFRKFGPTALGLLLIPLIVHPIDHFVTDLLDATTRKWWK